jgi:hypothetical protein
LVPTRGSGHTLVVALATRFATRCAIRALFHWMYPVMVTLRTSSVTERAGIHYFFGSKLTIWSPSIDVARDTATYAWEPG